eukprot:TRINITY_DN4666_c0_g1_i2.p1 TRINITY_DN4666_c0_g1~~TRINITY_DN4666_c0_g1_i2.p1  ORF type:complete len:275 (+),score=58.02 TRINITY_DN4666_c0_g1_i2:263-1087(+)
MYVDNIQKERVLGGGNFGKVFLGTWANSTPVAMKTVIDSSKLSELFEEAEIWKKLVHPNIVTFIGLYKESETEHLYIITEYMPDGNLRDFLKNNTDLPLVTLVKIIKDVACGMLQLENRGVIHLDLACRNILISNVEGSYRAKLADFGLSKHLNKEKSENETEILLPAKWSSPEAIQHHIFTTKSDVWSFGVVIWETFNGGATPYQDLSNRDTFEWILQGNRLQLPEECPDVLKQLVQNCWLMEPSSRPTFTDIVNILDELLKTLSTQTETETQ